MTGGTLILSRAVNLHNYYKKHLESIGFKNVFITDIDRDGLNMIIYEKKPSLVMIEACFYFRSTPYMMFELLNRFPELNIAAVNLFNYPDSHAKWFILNGVNSYINMFEGIEEFYKGLKFVRDGNNYISPNIEKLINEMEELPEKTKLLSKREDEILQLICSGRKENDIANILQISRSTVKTHKYNLFQTFNVTNTFELFWAALAAGKVTIDKSFYYANNTKGVNK